MIKISIKKRIPIIVLLAVAITAVLSFALSRPDNNRLMGGSLHSGAEFTGNETRAASGIESTLDMEDRFMRPSRQPAINTKYSLADIENYYGSIPAFRDPEDLIKAYFGILRDASNMAGYHGGCGTVGFGKAPYPYAYKLLSADAMKKLSYRDFEDSFRGTGHITLIKLIQAYSPPHTPEFIRYYMVELEVITGAPAGGSGGKSLHPSCFSYFYGLVTVGGTASEGWKIDKIDYMAEDFLCAPYHGWHWDGPAVVEVVYKNWYALVERIDRVETRGDMVRVYASGKGKDYRFDFTRLTNGADLMLHEYVMFAGQWKESEILREEHQNLKFSVRNPCL